MAELESLELRFTRMQSAARRVPVASWALRIQRLTTLRRLLKDNAEAIADAVRCDFGHRSLAETRLLELFPSYEAIRHARRHLHSWMRPQRRGVSLWFQPGRAEVRFQPLGVVGIIVPWNYPIYLAIGPLVAALAAGNRALVKMSEFTPATARLFAGLIASSFADDEVSVVEGDASVAHAFSQLPFDHLLFTGSTPVGHHVMRAAADNLTPVTLELGGKSPAIIGPDADFEKAVERIVVGKCLNAGQTCIAPDYVLLPAGKEVDFVAAARRVVAQCYPDLGTTPDYTSIINERHYQRLNGYVDEARAHGAEIIELAPGLAANASTRRLSPYLLFKVDESLRIMQDEIFGPLLPVLPYRDLDEAIAYVNARPRPLALYYFDRDRSNITRVLDHTIAGGVTINDTLLHIAQDDLPFGGVGPSGMGCYHGFEGFQTFSARKSVFRQSRLNGMGLFKPPYGKLFERLIGVLLR
jgi:acyl-CoA reductase-like NAD-dependent aldehyde dehydrogenase